MDFSIPYSPIFRGTQKIFNIWNIPLDNLRNLSIIRGTKWEKVAESGRKIRGGRAVTDE